MRQCAPARVHGGRAHRSSRAPRTPKNWAATQTGGCYVRTAFKCDGYVPTFELPAAVACDAARRLDNRCARPLCTRVGAHCRATMLLVGARRTPRSPLAQISCLQWSSKRCARATSHGARSQANLREGIKRLSACQACVAPLGRHMPALHTRSAPAPRKTRSKLLRRAPRLCCRLCLSASPFFGAGRGLDAIVHSMYSR